MTDDQIDELYRIAADLEYRVALREALLAPRRERPADPQQIALPFAPKGTP